MLLSCRCASAHSLLCYGNAFDVQDSHCAPAHVMLRFEDRSSRSTRQSRNIGCPEIEDFDPEEKGIQKSALAAAKKTIHKGRHRIFRLRSLDSDGKNQSKNYPVLPLPPKVATKGRP